MHKNKGHPETGRIRNNRLNMNFSIHTLCVIIRSGAGPNLFDNTIAGADKTPMII